MRHATQSSPPQSSRPAQSAAHGAEATPAHRAEATPTHKAEAAGRLRFAAGHDQDAVLAALGTTLQGLAQNAGQDGVPYTVQDAREKYGDNRLSHGKKQSGLARLAKAFLNPFTLILFILAGASACTDIWWAPPGQANPVTVIIILVIVSIAGLLRFVQETRSGHASEKLLGMIRTTTLIERLGPTPESSGNVEEIPLADVVVGDIVHLAAGDMIPADVRILRAKDLFVSQSALTGESEPVEKVAEAAAENAESAEPAENATGNAAPNAPRKAAPALTDCRNLAFMGTSVMSGTALAVAVVTGDATLFGEMARGLHAKPVKTAFEKGVNSVSWVLIRFMLIMVPVVFFLNGLTKGDWLDAFLFAISVAVGLTPEMLPMIVTTCLAKGAVSMSRKKTIIKKLDAIQNLGSIDILCTDKTGTLTQDKVVLQYHLNIQGEEDTRVLRYAFLNSHFQTGLKNLMDIAVVARAAQEEKDAGAKDGAKDPAGLDTGYAKVDEVPFDFERRRMSVVVADASGKTQMITKGAMEEMLSICAYAENRGPLDLQAEPQVVPMTDELKARIRDKAEALNDSGMRVIGLARKPGHPAPEHPGPDHPADEAAPAGAFSKTDESGMIFIGYLAFLDPPKDSAGRAIAALKANGVSVKVLTGDNDKVTRAVCRNIGLYAGDADTVLLGPDIEAMDGAALASAVETAHIFARLDPRQKARIVAALRRNGHAVGYMGDGINDTAAMKEADIAISVDTAVDVAKETSGVILLEKDLMVLEQGLMEGRKTYANMIKYIKITASSNFGNVLSVLAASAFLPFMPMLSLQIILLNLVYDISCVSLPWDNVDKEYLRVPRKWNAGNLGRFMVRLGPTSSVFDLTTFLLLYYVICPAACGGLLFHEIGDPAVRARYVALFQTGWFVESMWTQSLVIHMLRTPKISFVQSMASFPVFALTFAGIGALTVLPFTALGRAMGFTALPAPYFWWLGATVLAYMLVSSLAKTRFIKRYGELL